jgi:hypothetical protein
MAMTALESTWIRNQLVYLDSQYTQRWQDAYGPNVTKYVQEMVEWHPDTHTLTSVEVGAGSSVIAITGAKGGVAVITNAANEDDGLSIQLKGESFRLNGGHPLYFGTRLKISDATQSDLLVGLCITDTTLLGGMTDGVYFRKVDGATALNFVLEKNSTETTAAVHTMANDTYVTLEFYFDGTYVDTYVNNVLQTRIATTNLPDDEELTPSIEFLNGEAAVKTCSIDWIRCFQLTA